MLTNETLYQILEAVGSRSGLIYVSVPITSGPREIERSTHFDLRPRAYRAEHHADWLAEVVERNVAEAEVFAGSMRARFPTQIALNPAQLEVREWSQDEYNGFWHELIQRFATHVVATPGWALSKGARMEVDLAVGIGVPVIDVRGEALSTDDLATDDEKARARLSGAGWTDGEIEGYLPALANLERGPQEISRPARSDPASATFSWLLQERSYQVRKFGIELDDDHTKAGVVGEDTWWWQQLMNYWHRAGVLGLDTPVGRQAIAKFVATGCGLLESVIRVHGDLPEPGVSSGQIHSDDD